MYASIRVAGSQKRPFCVCVRVGGITMSLRPFSAPHVAVYMYMYVHCCTCTCRSVCFRIMSVFAVCV